MLRDMPLFRFCLNMLFSERTCITCLGITFSFRFLSWRQLRFRGRRSVSQCGTCSFAGEIWKYICCWYIKSYYSTVIRHNSVSALILAFNFLCNIWIDIHYTSWITTLFMSFCGWVYYNLKVREGKLYLHTLLKSVFFLRVLF